MADYFPLHFILSRHVAEKYQLKDLLVGIFERKYPSETRAVRTLAPSVGDFGRRKIGGKDHWRAYRDHPHFRSWVTDRRYRVVIEPTKPDRQALNLEP